jgi:glycosyltransferase involved in cell wall biosynthesis
LEIFAWGKYGGFGRATRFLGRELVKSGCEVYAVVPRRINQKQVEELDGIRVYSFPKLFPFASLPLLREIDADIYHSQEPSFTTYLAMKSMPHKKHLITFRDTRERGDWKVELDNPSLNKLQVLTNIIFEDNILVHKSVRQADSVFCAADCVGQKAKRKYKLRYLPPLLPTPVHIANKVNKAHIPTVCYIARLDKRKKPERFLKMPPFFPNVNFIVVGTSKNKDYDAYLRKTYSPLPNLEMTGFIDQFRDNSLSEILEKSWIMVNTASREGLPNSFLEAASHQCSILSYVNPDDFASRFGYHAKEDDFEKGLTLLLQQNRWQELGYKGYQFVRSTYATKIAVDKHIGIYELVLRK